tara:strand:+ start:1478 stop:1987 length:510 start_codon:yes stop_codon:yes gene_type:complete
MTILNHYITTAEQLRNMSTSLNIAQEMIENANQIFFIGNGGSQAACSHIAEDFCKVANKRAYSLEGSSFITCLSNDYGYDNVYKEWLKRFYNQGDVIVAISSSGQSNNIINACRSVNKDNVITLTAHNPNNLLRNFGKINFYLPTTSYGVAECYHQIILHIILDRIVTK